MDLSIKPSEEQCISDTGKGLNYFYAICQRGDVPITPRMKFAAYQQFMKEKQRSTVAKIYQTSTLADASESWFVDIQLQGWGYMPARYDTPYGWSQEQYAKHIAYHASKSNLHYT